MRDDIEPYSTILGTNESNPISSGFLEYCKSICKIPLNEIKPTGTITKYINFKKQQ